MEQPIEEKTVALKYEENYYVIQANELIRSRQEGFTLLEAKLVRLAIAQILEDDTSFRTYQCSGADLARYLEIPKENIYRVMDEVTDKLLQRVVTVREKELDSDGKRPWRKFQWVSLAKFKDGKITIRLNDELTPYLLGLSELFTRYNYFEIIHLPTVYSIRLFELLVSYQNLNFRTYCKKNYTNVALHKKEIGFSINYLREYFSCTSKYPNPGDFVRYVIDAGVRAIQENTLTKVSYRKVKHGRSITDIIFKLNDR